MPDRDANRAWYERKGVVRGYTRATHLESPERALLESLEPDLGRMTMLDLGVGAGRTTLHFAPRTAGYVGVDYSKPLIEECLKRFPSPPWSVAFEHADVRSMPMLDDASFDLVLFAVNSLDCLDHAGRLEALAEISRVCKPGGIFFFSTHNLDAIEKAVSVRNELRFLKETRSWARLPLAVAKRLPAQVLKRIANPSPARLLERDWVWISKLWPPRAPQMTYHVKPAEARRQVESVGFTIESVLLPSGEEVAFEDASGRRDALWLNFRCRKTSPGRQGVEHLVRPAHRG